MRGIQDRDERRKHGNIPEAWIYPLDLWREGRILCLPQKGVQLLEHLHDGASIVCSPREPRIELHDLGRATEVPQGRTSPRIIMVLIRMKFDNLKEPRNNVRVSIRVQDSELLYEERRRYVHGHSYRARWEPYLIE